MPQSPATGALAVEGLAKAFGAVTVLGQVGLSVPAGEVVALLGPSGCGKTTLLRCIAGLERPDAGEVRVGDRVLTGPRHVRAAGAAAGRHGVPGRALFPHMTWPRTSATACRAATRARGAGRRGARARGPGRPRRPRCRPRCPAASSSGWPWPGPCARARRCCSSTSRSPTSTRPCASGCGRGARLLAALGITTVFVTHDQEEAFVLGDEVAVMRRRPHRAAGRRPPSCTGCPAAAGSPASSATPTSCRRGGRGAADTAVGRGARSAPSAAAPVEVLVRPEQLRLRGRAGRHRRAVEYYGHDAVYLVDLADGAGCGSRVIGAPAPAAGDRVDARLRRRRPRSPAPPCPRRRADRADLARCLARGRPGWAPPSGPRRAGHRVVAARAGAGGGRGWRPARGRRPAGRPRQPPAAPGHRARLLGRPARPARRRPAAPPAQRPHPPRRALGRASRCGPLDLARRLPPAFAAGAAARRRPRPVARGPRADTFAEVVRAGLGPTDRRRASTSRTPASSGASTRASWPASWPAGACRRGSPGPASGARGSAAPAARQRHLPLPAARLRADRRGAGRRRRRRPAPTCALGAAVDARRPRPGRRASRLDGRRRARGRRVWSTVPLPALAAWPARRRRRGARRRRRAALPGHGARLPRARPAAVHARSTPTTCPTRDTP